MSKKDDWLVQPDGTFQVPMFRRAQMGSTQLAIAMRLETGPVPTVLKSAQSQVFLVGLTTTDARRLATDLLAAADKLDGRLGGKA